MADQPNPRIPAHPAKLDYPLHNLARQIFGSKPVKIVAIGSSSTAGRAPVIPFPYRLETLLRQHYRDLGDRDKDRLINVLNRGLGGEEAPIEFDRLDRDVVREQPAAVIWQVGTNAAWKGDDVQTFDNAIRRGIELLVNANEKGIDMLLIDPQYVPAIVTPYEVRRRTDDILARIDRAAADARVNLFRRFDLMRAWHEDEKVSLDNLVDVTDPDRLHQSDWSTQRVAQALCDVIVDAITAADRAAGRIS